VLPKDIEDGSFTRRIPTSDDKLLQQLIGKKKAKAHIAAKQEAARPNASTKVQQYVKQSAAKKDESDEEEGRAATFKSKRQKKKEKQTPRKVDSDDEDEESRAKRLAATAKNGDAIKEVIITDTQVDDELTQSNDYEAEVTPSASKRTKAKPKSFLDEILAERSKKKGNKGK